MLGLPLTAAEFQMATSVMKRPIRLTGTIIGCNATISTRMSYS